MWNEVRLLFLNRSSIRILTFIIWYFHIVIWDINMSSESIQWFIPKRSTSDEKSLSLFSMSLLPYDTLFFCRRILRAIQIRSWCVSNSPMALSFHIFRIVKVYFRRNKLCANHHDAATIYRFHKQFAVKESHTAPTL